MQHGGIHRKKGFTLIELSIVLVIIGLIVGGLLAGRSLIQAAALKSVITDVNRYVTAVNTFRTKYNNELPGDMADATTFWGTSAWCPTPLGTTTCNGDGNGQICNGGAQADDGGCTTEGLLVWQHLSNAGLVPGTYTGAIVAGKPYYVPGTNLPASSAFPNAGFSLFYYGPIIGSLFFKSSGINHVITFGAQSSTNHWNWEDNPLYPILSTYDAYNIDAKIDDGMPGTGNVLSLPKGSDFTPGNTATAVCATGGFAAAATATYDFTQTGPQCSLIFVTGF